MKMSSSKESIGGAYVNKIKEEVGCEPEENCPTNTTIKDDEPYSESKVWSPYNEKEAGGLAQ